MSIWEIGSSCGGCVKLRELSCRFYFFVFVPSSRVELFPATP
uniref:Uncharacterized protein n=1 Tax=Arundo donax TaxID=35708 RepID=A0A0A8Y9F1_ARUDO